MKARFITIEGGEGSGKTTLIKLLRQDLEKDKIEYIVSREPGGSKISEDIRKIILDTDNVNMNYMTEALLYAASRCQHLEEVIKPALDKNKLVICDRYIDASLAYQGYARGLGISTVYDINMYATGGFLPDLTIIIDIDPEVGLERIRQNRRNMDRLDLEKMTFHERVRAGYLEVHRQFSDRVVIINGNRELEEVYQDFKKIIYQRISYGL